MNKRIDILIAGAHVSIVGIVGTIIWMIYKGATVALVVILSLFIIFLIATFPVLYMMWRDDEYEEDDS